jgi:hypothetical protein
LISGLVVLSAGAVLLAAADPVSRVSVSHSGYPAYSYEYTSGGLNHVAYQQRPVQHHGEGEAMAAAESVVVPQIHAVPPHAPRQASG